VSRDKHTPNQRECVCVAKRLNRSFGLERLLLVQTETFCVYPPIFRFNQAKPATANESDRSDKPNPRG